MSAMTQPALPPQTAAAPARRRPVLRFLGQCWQNWRLRHQLPFNFAVHVLGIPLAVAGLGVLLAAPFSDVVEWYWGVAGLAIGYLLQYVGHRAEGNDVGEWAAIKRLLGLPCVGISPRWQKPE